MKIRNAKTENENFTKTSTKSIQPMTRFVILKKSKKRDQKVPRKVSKW